jgi:hypothetical protein
VQAIERALKQATGASARVNLRPAGSFELSEGKTARVLRTYQ